MLHRLVIFCCYRCIFVGIQHAVLQLTPKSSNLYRRWSIYSNPQAEVKDVNVIDFGFSIILDIAASSENAARKTEMETEEERGEGEEKEAEGEEQEQEQEQEEDEEEGTPFTADLAFQKSIDDVDIDLQRARDCIAWGKVTSFHKVKLL